MRLGFLGRPDIMNGQNGQRPTNAPSELQRSMTGGWFKINEIIDCSTKIFFFFFRKQVQVKCLGYQANYISDRALPIVVQQL